MPRSGDWMNAVKVVGGLVEIGAALKFVNTAELAFVTPENAWFNAQRRPDELDRPLGWSAGFYLLGLFRTDHDHDEVKVGPGRLIFGAMFLGLALFMAPALFGQRAPEHGLESADRRPPAAGRQRASARRLQIAGGGGESLPRVKATSADPAQAEREQKSFHGVLWGMSFDQARELAAAEKKPILIDFTGVNCANCRQMEQGVFPRPDVAQLLQEVRDRPALHRLCPDRLDPPGANEEASRAQPGRQLDLAQEATNPFYVVLSPDGEVIDKIGGYNEPRRSSSS